MTRRDLGHLMLLSAIWGSSFLFIKLGVDELEPAVVVFGRTFVGVAVLLPLLVGRGGLAALRGSVVSLAILAVVNNVLPFWLLGFAETRIDTGLTAVIQAAAPIFTVLLAARLDPGQAVRGLRLVGIATGFVGVALLVGLQRGSEVAGAVAVLGTALCYAVSVLYAGRTVRNLPPLQVSIGQLGFAAVLIAPVAAVQRPSELPSSSALLAVTALGALGSGFAYLIYFALIASAGASRAILVTYLVPAFALLYGTVLLDEPLTAVAVTGLGLVLVGTALATGFVRRRSRATVRAG